MKRYFRFAAFAIASLALLGICVSFGASYYYTSQYGQGCASCHEMASYVSAVHGSPHRTVGCMDCHEATMATKLRHIRVHLFGTPPEVIRLRDVDVLAMSRTARTATSTNMPPGMPARTAPRSARSSPARCKTPSAADGRLPPLPWHALQWLDWRSGPAAEHEGPLAIRAAGRSASDALSDLSPDASGRRSGDPACIAHLRSGRGRARFARLLRPPGDTSLAATALSIPQLYEGARW